MLARDQWEKASRQLGAHLVDSWLEVAGAGIRHRSSLLQAVLSAGALHRGGLRRLKAGRFYTNFSSDCEGMGRK